MSEIDSDKHKDSGIIACPSTFEIVAHNGTHRNIPLYRLDESTIEWKSKPGDLLLGGVSGESEALSISIPEDLKFFMDVNWDQSETKDQIYKADWNMTGAYLFGEGYARLGWTPQEPIEKWLVEHFLAFLLNVYPDTYHGDIQELDQDGNICGVPEPGSNEAEL